MKSKEEIRNWLVMESGLPGTILAENSEALIELLHRFTASLQSLPEHKGGELYSNEPEYFADWIGDKYVKMFGGWMPRYADQRMTENLITTEELYKLYITTKN